MVETFLQCRFHSPLHYSTMVLLHSTLLYITLPSLYFTLHYYVGYSKSMLELAWVLFHCTAGQSTMQQPHVLNVEPISHSKLIVCSQKDNAFSHLMPETRSYWNSIIHGSITISRRDIVIHARLLVPRGAQSYTNMSFSVCAVLSTCQTCILLPVGGPHTHVQTVVRDPLDSLQGHSRRVHCLWS